MRQNIQVLSRKSTGLIERDSPHFGWGQGVPELSGGLASASALGIMMGLRRLMWSSSNVCCISQVHRDAAWHPWLQGACSVTPHPK